jgi:inosine/xanthosine triphosphatase
VLSAGVADYTADVSLHTVPSVAAVGSTNPVKVAAARAVLTRAFPECAVHGLPVPSGVPDQPWGDDETRRGAAERARGALGALRGAPGALGIGFEGGVVDEGGTLRTCAWAAVATPDGRVHLGGSLAMPLPEAVARRLRAGQELGTAVDALLGVTGTKHGGGAVGVLTRGMLDRQRAYEVLLTYALAPLLAPEHWDGAAGP